MGTTTTSSETNKLSISSAGFFAHRPRLAFGALIAVNAMWAFQFAGVRIATQELGAVLVTLIPLVLATLLAVPFSKLSTKLLQSIDRRVLIDIFLLGTFGIVPAQLCLVLGVERTLASNASVLALTVPIFTVLSASVFLHERMTKLRWVSFAIAIVGACMISIRDIYDARLFHLSYMIGNFLVLASCVGSAFYNSYTRRALALLSPAQVLVLSFSVADIELFIIDIFTDRGGWKQLPHLQPSVWWSLILVAIFSLGVSMLLYFAVIQSVEVMRAAFSIYMLPAFGLFFSVVLLGERLTPNLIAGGILIFFSCFLVTVYEEKQRKGRVSNGTV